MDIDFPTAKVEEISAPGDDAIAIGPFGSDMKSDCYVDEGVPVIRGSNINSGRSFDGEFVFITEEKADELSSSNVFPGNLVFPHRGAIGEVGLIPENGSRDRWMLSSSLMKLTPNEEKTLPEFLYYYFCSEVGKHELLKKASTVGTPGIGSPLSSLRDAEVPCPPLPVQRRIAGILGAYDDLIANNRRRIELLEEMATAIFREWFVHYRFPGHAVVEMRETEMGAVPKHWEVVTVPEAIKVNPRIPIPDGEKHYVPMSNVNEDSMVVTHAEMRDQRRGRKFQNGDTLFARITPSLENGKTGFVQFLPSDDAVGVGSGELIGLRSKTLCPEYVYLLARTERFRQNAIKSMTGSAGRQRVKLDCFDNFPIFQPDQDTLDRFEDTVRPMFESVQNLVERNQVLRETRDLLLPRLVAGEIAIDRVSKPGDQKERIAD